MSRHSRARRSDPPPGFIPPCRPSAARRPPSGAGWLHELKHDGFRLQVHICDGGVRLFTINGDDWTDRYRLIVDDAARIKGSAILDAEVVCTGEYGASDF